MHIEFTANDVSYNEALGGDIVQIYLEEDGNDDSFNPSKYYIHISANYEFPPFTAKVDWFDGNEEDGGIGIANYKISKNSLQLWLDNGMSFCVNFDTEKNTFSSIKDFLSNAVKG